MSDLQSSGVVVLSQQALDYHIRRDHDENMLLDDSLNSVLLSLFDESQVKSLYEEIQDNPEKIPAVMVHCKICTEDVKDAPWSSYTYDCGHVYCRPCLREYYQHMIGAGNVLDMKCPHPQCSYKVAAKDVKAIVTKPLFERYDHFTVLAVLAREERVWWCPLPKCAQPTIACGGGGAGPPPPPPSSTSSPASAVVTNDASAIIVVSTPASSSATIADSAAAGARCATCDHTWCLRCNEEPHPAQPSCEKAAQARRKSRDSNEKTSATQFNGWAKANRDYVKKCPNCVAIIQKNEGCNHMTCKSCKHQFCWVCMGVYTMDHYTTVDMPCYGKQHVDVVADRIRMRRESRQRILRILGKTLFAVTLGIPCLVVGGPIYGIYKLVQHFRNRNRAWKLTPTGWVQQ
eukprot:TRINITY_DN143_c0_g2_i1.p1 TRINITY_DN143_c0_g2~~TRINITY_DN143_c0_g2_i1.p1  ORF type:complete len:402 (-),score=41.63 TRINITY_DN143_c0_g2_i1:12-1217(-)